MRTLAWKAISVAGAHALVLFNFEQRGDRPALGRTEAGRAAEFGPFSITFLAVRPATRARPALAKR